MGVDVRFRTDGAVPRHSPDELFDEVLPARLDAAADRFAVWLGERRVRPLTVAVGERSWTLDHAAGRITISRGEHATKRAILTDEQVADLAADLITPMAWLATGELAHIGARLEHLLDWWIVLRALLDDTAPHVRGAIELVDAAGEPLDLTRRFSIDDDPAAMADFCERAGYLHIAGVFSEAEMAAVSAEMDAAAPRYVDGDGRSWWATLNDGSDALVRMQGFDRESSAAAALADDPRMWRLAALSGDGHRFGVDHHNRIEALFKPIGVARGISDVPWHKDCSLGRHSYDCCALNMGISVTGADAESGQLRVVAGSHRALIWPAPSLQPGLDLPVVDLATETGDVTIHLSCTLHMAQPPVVRGRRVMYTWTALPPRADAPRDARARLGEIRESASVTVSQPPSPSPAAS